MGPPTAPCDSGMTVSAWSLEVVEAGPAAAGIWSPARLRDLVVVVVYDCSCDGGRQRCMSGGGGRERLLVCRGSGRPVGGEMSAGNVVWGEAVKRVVRETPGESGQLSARVRGYVDSGGG